MALASLIGFALQRWLGWDGALAAGLLLGMVAANFVPLAPCGGDADA
ncbi:MAG: hypothetical protein INH34_16845 [Phycisphaerales bacterium]|nr:hypothetical protein [Phycisphaerales bacterium]